MVIGTAHPSSDTVERGLKELRANNEIYISEIPDKEYKFNTAEKLNQLLLRMINHLGLIKEGSAVDLNFDDQLIPAHKYDAKNFYKGDYGYFPGWAICDLPFLRRALFLCLSQPN